MAAPASNNGPIARRLTQREIYFSRTVFGDHIDYSKVVIHNRKFFFGQFENVAMTPDGEIYISPSYFKSDYSKTASDMAWIIHEMTHVWQHQHGYAVAISGLMHLGAYDYGNIDGISYRFTQYNIEQQGAIVGDYFRMNHGLKAEHGSGSPASYEKLIPFLSRKR